MGHWRVRLIGNQFELEEFPALFTSPNFLIVEEDNDFFLESDYLETFEDDGDVHKAAERLLQILNAVAMLWIGNFRKVQMSAISRVNADSTREGALFHSIDAIIVAHCRVQAILGGGPRPWPPASWPGAMPPTFDMLGSAAGVKPRAGPRLLAVGVYTENP